MDGQIDRQLSSKDFANGHGSLSSPPIIRFCHVYLLGPLDTPMFGAVR